MFTKKQIDEIAAKLADLAVKDSEFYIFKKPLNGSEHIPLLQDGENRLMTLPDLINLLVGEEDRQYIKCILTVQCLTSNAVIKIKGESDFDYVTRTSYTAYYGEIVDVKISADGHDTWYDVVTMTQNHTIVVSLNEEGGGGGGTPSVTQYYVKITNNQGADIKINGSSVISGSINYFEAGTPIDISVTKDGFKPEIVPTFNLNSNFIKTYTLTEDEGADDNYVRFDAATTTGEISRSGGVWNSKVQSNIDWEITASDVADADSDIPEDKALTAELPENLGLYVGETMNINDYMNGFTWIPKDQSKVTTDDDTISGDAAGSTEGNIYDENGTNRGVLTVTTSNKDSSDVPVTGISVDPKSVYLKYMDNNLEVIKATVYPSNATNKNVIWTSSDATIVGVSSKGWATAKNKDGSATITAYTWDRKYSATCDVIVKAQGTFVKKVIPAGPVSIPDKGAIKDFQVTLEDKGGAGYAVYTGEVSGKEISLTNAGFKEVFPVNWGNERVINLSAQGLFCDDPGVYVTVNQEACKVIKEFYNDTSYTFPANGNERAMMYSIYFRCALSELTPDNVTPGDVQKNMQILNRSGKSIVAKAKICSQKNINSSPVSWLSFESNTGVFASAGLPSATHEQSYKRDGTVNGQFKNFTGTGKIATYYATIICSANTSSSSRTAYIAFPTYRLVKHAADGTVVNTSNYEYGTYEEDYIYFTVNQQAGQ